MKRLACLLCVLAVPATGAVAEEISFRRVRLSDTFLSEGATAGDLNRDGKPDVISGPYWYEGPDFRTRHEYAPVKQFDAARGYSDNFFAYVEDFNGDGWTDILIIGFPGTHAAWYENPQGREGHWPRHVAVAAGVDNESAMFADLTGDGRRELVYHTEGRLGYATPDPTDATKPWTFHPVSPKGDRNAFAHGLGVGDVNGDGRPDLLERTGWWEQPASLDKAQEWRHHPADFGHGAQIHVYDVDADGLPDVISSLMAHGYGLAWFKQVRGEDGGVSFEKNLIMGHPAEKLDHGVVFSQLHAVELADINADGLPDVVTGKRFWAHGPHGDPEPNAPAVTYWFELRRPDGQPPRFVPHLMNDDTGVGTQVVATDVNGDGRLDVVVGNKKGTTVLIQERGEAKGK